MILVKIKICMYLMNITERIPLAATQLERFVLAIVPATWMIPQSARPTARARV